MTQIEAARQLIEFRPFDAAAGESVLSLITPRTSPVLGGGFIEAVARSEAPDVGGTLAAARRVSWRFDGELPQARRHARRTAV